MGCATSTETCAPRLTDSSKGRRLGAAPAQQAHRLALQAGYLLAGDQRGAEVLAGLATTTPL